MTLLIKSSRSFNLSRRQVLRGAGVAMGLPLLEAMQGQQASAQTASPTRLLAYYVPNGMHMASWRPTDTGANYTLSPTLEPLASIKDDVLVLSNLENRPANAFGDGAHASGTGSFITATRVNKTAGDDIRNGISLDQVVAARLGSRTKFPSLELGMSGGGSAGNCDSGYSCAYTRNIAWSGPQTPVPKLTDPLDVFERLFSDTQRDAVDNSVEAQRRRALRESIMDSVRDDARSLQQKLGQVDRAKLDEYLTGVQQLERSLVTVSAACPWPERPDVPENVTEKVRLMSDLMVVAFQCDLTRAQTFMLDNAASNRSYAFLGVEGAHHEISHHQGLKSNHDKLKVINRWEIEQFAYLLERLKSTVDVNGTSLLAASTVFLSSDISDGDWHNHNNMPILLAGQANGYFNTGRHIVYEQGGKVADLFMAMLDAVGAPVSQFGDDGTKILEGLS